jgi:8-oxo-dGTP diphosphatase
MIVAASCHTHAEVMHASALDVDFAVLGPVLPTPTHPAAPPLGWHGFAAAVAGTRVPVFALGGLSPADLDIAIAHGAHGIAMRRHAWPAGSDQDSSESGTLGSPDSGASGVLMR